jgi:penicillin amidase
MEDAMRRMAKLVGVIGVILLVLLLVLMSVAIWFVRRPWSKVDGEIEIPGVSVPVEVIRDQWGVPHIYAENEHDLFFAQGYVHAQDRLWQMEFNRRTSSGTLSEVLGESTLGIDQFMRTLGLREAAQRDWATVDDDTGELLEAYAQGVNAYIEAHSKRLPLEFTILGADPGPWTPVDSLAWGKVMAYSLSGNYTSELLRARVIAELGPEAAQQLMPPYPDGAPVIVPPEARSYAWLENAQLSRPDVLEAALGENRAEWGSNNWVVHGSRTATGMPLLADDTHLGLDMPSVWYENGIHGGRFDSVGYTFPGVPLVVIGHNGQIAWGVTNLGPDVQDLYIEKLDDPVRPTKYQFKGQWRDLQIRYETIEVKNQEPVFLNVLETHHGPIINRVAGDLVGTKPLALRWTALDAGSLFRSVMLLGQATDWDSFRQALSHWDVPSQNFVYADVEGNIGYQTPGKIPIRAAGHQGLVPVPGWTGDYEWQGFIPFDELPSVLNPPTGFVATANNKVVPDDYPYHLSYEWAQPYRAQRITDLLAASEQVSIEDMRDIHAQTYSLPAEALVPYLLEIEPETELEASSLALVRDWDLFLETDRPAASVYQVWYWFLVRNTLRDELGEDLFDTFGSSHIATMMDLMPDATSPWFDDVTTSQVESRSDIVARSLSDAVQWLSQELGDDPGAWAWGKLHTKTFVHMPLGQSGIGLVETLFNSPTIAARGDGFTVDAAPFGFGKPYAMGGGVSQRYIADLSNLDNSRIVHTTGQSGQLFHKHREDFIPLWQNIEYHPMLFGRQAVEGYAETVLVLTPP